VAVKTLRKGGNEDDQKDFLKEAQYMSIFKHENIVTLIGICLDNEPKFLIMELMEGGDLSSFLRKSRGANSRFPLSSLDLSRISSDVASGCAYLEKRKFVHRDLAARNCLVSSVNPAKRRVKIGDFGLARDIYKSNYYRKTNGKFPVRWMSPEALTDGVYTTQSDVWAFGVILWEIFTLGQQPYPGRVDNMDVCAFVQAGGQLEVPEKAPEAVRKVMLKCWSYNPEERPAFKHSLKVIDDLIAEQVKGRNFLVFAHIPLN